MTDDAVWMSFSCWKQVRCSVLRRQLAVTIEERHQVRHDFPEEHLGCDLTMRRRSAFSRCTATQDMDSGIYDYGAHR